MAEEKICMSAQLLREDQIRQTLYHPLINHLALPENPLHITLDRAVSTCETPDYGA